LETAIDRLKQELAASQSRFANNNDAWDQRLEVLEGSWPVRIAPSAKAWFVGRAIKGRSVLAIERTPCCCRLGSSFGEQTTRISRRLRFRSSTVLGYLLIARSL
jgi:hypothetical protein